MEEEAVIKMEDKRYVLLKMADRSAFVIGQVIEESRDEVVLYYPVQVTVYNDHEGMNIITSKYLPFAEGDLVSIVKTSIHSVAAPKQSLIAKYIEFKERWRTKGIENQLEDAILGTGRHEEKEPDPRVLDDSPRHPEDPIH